MTRRERVVQWASQPWMLLPFLEPLLPLVDPTFRIEPMTVVVIPGRIEPGWRTVVLGQGGQ